MKNGIFFSATLKKKKTGKARSQDSAKFYIKSRSAGKGQTPQVERGSNGIQVCLAEPNFYMFEGGMDSLSPPELTSLGYCGGLHEPYKERKPICSKPRSLGERFESPAVSL